MIKKYLISFFGNLGENLTNFNITDKLPSELCTLQNILSYKFLCKPCLNSTSQLNYFYTIMSMTDTSPTQNWLSKSSSDFIQMSYYYMHINLEDFHVTYFLIIKNNHFRTQFKFNIAYLNSAVTASFLHNVVIYIIYR